MNAQKCENRIDEEYNKTIEAFNNMEIGSEEFNEYGLDFSLVEANTFNDQPEPYYRYQLSWGGPSEEFRIYEGGAVEFWFMDWFDGAGIDVTNEPIVKELVEFFDEVGLIDWNELIPARCMKCDDIISPDEGPLCDDCKEYELEILSMTGTKEELIEELEGIIEDLKMSGTCDRPEYEIIEVEA
jgi:hypothetical protein